MTRAEIITAIADALTTAPKTTPSAVLRVLRDAGQFIEDQSATPSLGLLADRLERAAAVTVGLHDTESKAARINETRVTEMRAIARELRSLP